MHVYFAFAAFTTATHVAPLLRSVAHSRPPERLQLGWRSSSVRGLQVGVVKPAGRAILARAVLHEERARLHAPAQRQAHQIELYRVLLRMVLEAGPAVLAVACTDVVVAQLCASVPRKR